MLSRAMLSLNERLTCFKIIVKSRVEFKQLYNEKNKNEGKQNWQYINVEFLFWVLSKIRFVLYIYFC